MRCCKNCAFYNPGAHYDCRETVEELVADKERANFCEHFRLITGAVPGIPTAYDKAQAAREKLAKLFA
jgi:hypothetical protein